MTPLDFEKKFEDLENQIKGLSNALLGVTDYVKQEFANLKPQIIEVKDLIRVTHNSKGTNWEIRLVDKKGRDIIKELDKLEKSMTDRYGGKK